MSENLGVSLWREAVISIPCKLIHVLVWINATRHLLKLHATITNQGEADENGGFCVLVQLSSTSFSNDKLLFQVEYNDVDF
jgi:hypothetical protein